MDKKNQKYFLLNNLYIYLRQNENTFVMNIVLIY